LFFIASSFIEIAYSILLICTAVLSALVLSCFSVWFLSFFFCTKGIGVRFVLLKGFFVNVTTFPIEEEFYVKFLATLTLF